MTNLIEHNNAEPSTASGRSARTAYAIKSMYLTLQGEGAHTGRPAVFLRFAGCNLWTGREEDRASAICQFCDTDFRGTDGPGGGVFQTPRDLARAVGALWPERPAHGRRPYVVCTGGEPLLQLDEALIAELHHAGFEVAVETNGTLTAPEGVDWVCVSPKPMRGVGAGKWENLKVRSGDELKLVYPQEGVDPLEFESLDFKYFWLQPMDGPNREENTRLAVDYCLRNPRWRLSMQMHKIVGIE